MPPASALRQALGAALAALALAWIPLAQGADAVPGKPVRDLYYGEVLFHFYQDQHFDALTHLLAARGAGRVDNHLGESELLLGGLYLHYGQHRRAEDIFTRLLTAEVSADVRDRAWFYLGKVRYQRGLHEEALASFARVADSLPAALSAELPMLRAQAFMALGRFDDAARELDAWKGPAGWIPYARYNLGVALVRLGRTDDGARQLAAVGAGPAETPELLDLRDKANLALGYAWLQEGRDVEARPVLERVRLKGPFSNKALLGVGWSDAAKKDYRAALTPWLELQGRDLLDSAVQESLLAVPYAYAQLDAHGSAAKGYESALAAYDDEIGRLDTTIARARDGGLVPAVLAVDDRTIGRWYWELEEVPDSIEARYLYHLIANNDFQEGLRNVRDLIALSAHLDAWRDSLDTFQEMVGNRRRAHAERAPVFDAGLAGVDLESLHARRDSLARRLETIEATRDVAGLANAEELDRWQRLEAIGRDPGLSADPALAGRHRLLRGVLAWDLDREYRYRLWEQKRELRMIDAQLARSDSLHSEASAAKRGTPHDLDAFSARIGAVVPRLERMQQSIRRLRGQQEVQLQALAIDVLEDQKQRLSAYRVQAQFALATIYDRAATSARAVPDAERVQ